MNFIAPLLCGDLHVPQIFNKSEKAAQVPFTSRASSLDDTWGEKSWPQFTLMTSEQVVAQDRCDATYSTHKIPIDGRRRIDYLRRKRVPQQMCRKSTKTEPSLVL